MKKMERSNANIRKELLARIKRTCEPEQYARIEKLFRGKQ